MVNAATQLAADEGAAYLAGRVVGALLVLAVGAWLLIAGIRKRRAATPAPVVWAPPPAPGPDGTPPPAEWQTAPPPAPAGKPGGTVQIVVGSLLLAAGILGPIGQAASSASFPERTLTLPATLLGENQNAALTAQIRSQFLESLPDELEQGDMAVYGGTPPAFMVLGGTGKLSSPSREIDSFHEGVSSSGQVTISNSRSVPTGPLGGKGQCSDAVFNGAAKVQVCVYVDRGSLVSVIDLAASPANSADRSLQIRNAVLREG